MERSVKLEAPHEAPVMYGPGDKYLRMIREMLEVKLWARSGEIQISGPPKNVARAEAVLKTLQRDLRGNRPVTAASVAEAISSAAADKQSHSSDVLDVYVSGQMVRPKTAGQKRYLKAIQKHDLVFCTGPAGTGKTYLAVAVAVHLLKHHQAKGMN